MIVAPIIWMLWSTKVLHANFPLICAIFSIMFMKPSHLTRACSQGIWFHPDARIIPTNVNLLTSSYRESTSFNDLATRPYCKKPPCPSIKYWRFQTYFIPITYFCGFYPMCNFKCIFIFMKLLMHVCNSSWSGQCNISSCFVFLSVFLNLILCICAYEFWCILFDPWAPMKNSVCTDGVSLGKRRSNKIK